MVRAKAYGKQVKVDGEHYADARSEQDASLLADLLNKHWLHTKVRPPIITNMGQPAYLTAKPRLRQSQVPPDRLQRLLAMEQTA